MNKKVLIVIFLFIFLSLSASLSSSGVLLNKKWRAQIKDALGIESLEKQANCSTTKDKEVLLQIITDKKECPKSEKETSRTVSIPGTSGTVSIPGTSGTVSIPGTSGTVSIPGTSGTVSIPGTSGTEQIPIDEMFIKNPTTNKCLQDGGLGKFSTLNECSNTDKRQLWEYDKTNKTLSTPENFCLNLKNFVTGALPQISTCQPSNGLFQWEYINDTKQLRNVGLNQCLNDSARVETCTKITSPQQEWEFVDPYPN
jgi:hypothetical protein